MSSFTGVSVVTDGKHCTTSAINTGTDSGYHLLVVKDYSHTVQAIPNGEEISFGPFMVGGHQWSIDYFPNGDDPSSAYSISLFLCFVDEDVGLSAEVKYQFSFIDQVEYQRPMHIRANEACNFTSEFPLHGCSKFVKRDFLERSTHLKDDCFTIRCDIMVCNDSNTQDIGETMSDIGQHLVYFLQNKVGADVTFEVSGETFPAHRCVLAARSTVFMAQLFGPMKEGTTSGVIQVKDMEAKLFRALLSFIYTGSFPKMDKYSNMEEDKAGVVEEGKSRSCGRVTKVKYVSWLQDLFVAADRFDLQRLKLLCEENLSKNISVSSVASTLFLAEQHHCQRLRETCLEFIQVQSPPRLDKVMADKVMATNGWEHITTTYPSILNELISKLASNQKDKKRKR